MVNQSIDNQVRRQYLVQSRLINQSLIDRYQLALEHLSPIMRPPTLKQIVEAAPFYRYGYIEWMIRRMAARQLTRANLDETKRLLFAFDVLKERPFFRVSELSRDIGSYENIDMLKEKLEPLMPRISQPGRRKSMTGLNLIERGYYQRGEAILIANRTDYKVVVPLSVAAARYFEHGTIWCTSTKKSLNYLYYYLVNGLSNDVIFRFSPKRLGMHIPLEHHVDQLDQKLKLSAILIEHPTLVQDLKGQLLEAISFSDEAILSAIPLAERSLDFCMAAVKRKGHLLVDVPKALRNYEICEIAVKQNGSALRDVPDNLRHHFYQIAVEGSGAALQYVPEDLRDEHLCRLAVMKNGMAIQYVPQSLRKDLYELAVAQNGMSLLYVPNDLRTEALCRAAVTNDGRALQHVPDAEWRKSLYELAIQQNGLALLYIPHDHIDRHLCLLAVTGDGTALNIVPSEFRSRAICLAAVKENGQAIQYVPKHHQDISLCKAAIKNDWRAIHYITEKQWQAELWMLAAFCFHDAFEHMPKKYGSTELYNHVVSRDGCMLEHVPHYRRTQSLCELAIENDSYSIVYFPTHLQTDKMFLTALMNWRNDYEGPSWSHSFPPLPPDKADIFAQAIGLRFDRNGAMSLVPPDEDYLRANGVEISQAPDHKKRDFKPVGATPA